jgi:hypothetical protein
MEVIFGISILENIKLPKIFHAAEKKIIFADLCNQRRGQLNNPINPLKTEFLINRKFWEELIAYFSFILI